MSYDKSNFGFTFECIPHKNTLPLTPSNLEGEEKGGKSAKAPSKRMKKTKS